MVSAKQGDNSVAMAIQSLVRHVLEKLHLPRKWRPVEKPKEEPKPTEVQYDKLQMTGLEKVGNSYIQLPIKSYMIVILMACANRKTLKRLHNCAVCLKPYFLGYILSKSSNRPLSFYDFSSNL